MRIVQLDFEEKTQFLFLKNLSSEKKTLSFEKKPEF